MLGQSRRERQALVAAGFAASLIVYVLLPRPEKLGEIPAAWLLIVFLFPATASITAALFDIGALATWVPSRRAMRIEPAILLRM